MGFLGPTLEGSFSQMAGYGPGYYGRFPKDLGCAAWCWLVKCISHVSVVPPPSISTIFGGSLLPDILGRAGRRGYRKYVSWLDGRLSRAR